MTGVYALIDKTTDSCYFGSSINCVSRIRSHIALLEKRQHPNRRLQSAWTKHGRDAFEVTQILECQRHELLARERFMVDNWPVEMLFNNIRVVRPPETLVGPNKGKKFSKEWRAKLSLAKKGKPGWRWTDEQRAALSKTTTGKPKSEAHKAALKAAKRRRIE